MINASELTKLEHNRQKNTLNLIASENYPSPKVLDLLGSVWSNKYAEGYPSKRYYAGNIYSDQLEIECQNKALQVFDKTGEYGVNVQVLSGSPANLMVYLTVLDAGDTVMALNLSSGGHLSHLHASSSYLKFYNLVNYEVKEVEDNIFEIDFDDFEAKLKTHSPKLTIIGFSAYPRQYQFEKLIKLCHDNGSLVLADIAHINGLVAAGLHDSPFKSGDLGADFVSMTLHKTLRGPRGAMLFAKNNWINQINKTVFPGTSGGPHLQTIAAALQCLDEILGYENYPDNINFVEYTKSVINNCKQLENGLEAGGLKIISKTQNHLCLTKLPDDLDSHEVQKKLEIVGIITNRNQIPFDQKTPWKPSGLRLGTAALTSRGLDVESAFELGANISKFVLDQITEKEIVEFVNSLVANLTWYYE
jgi:glycine hydroxymethyltransferase